MPIDASIYQNVRPVQMPNPIESAEGAMKLSQLGMQQQAMRRTLETQQAMKDAYAKNIDPQSGQLNQQGFLSDLGKFNPKAALQYGQQFNQMAKQQADAQAAKIDSAKKIMEQTMPSMEYLAGLPEDQRAAAFPNIVKQLQSQGVPVQNVPSQYDPGWFRQTYNTMKNTKAYLDNQVAQSGSAKNYAEINKIQQETGDLGSKRAMALQADLDPNKARGGNLAKSQSVINAADRLGAMFKQFPDYNIPRAQQTELVSAFGAILNGGSAPLQSQMEELVPKSALGDATTLAAWVSNDPMGQNQQKFMKLLHDSVDREKAVAENQVKTAQVQRLGAHDLLKKTNPDQYYAILHGYGIEPENIQNGKYVSPDETTSAVAPDSNMVRMKGPDGKIYRIPKSQYGAAIANGGSLVK